MESAERSAVQVETAVGMGWVDVRADAMARVAQEELQDLVVVLEDVVVPLVVMVAAGVSHSTARRTRYRLQARTRGYPCRWPARRLCGRVRGRPALLRVSDDRHTDCLAAIDRRQHNLVRWNAEKLAQMSSEWLKGDGVVGTTEHQIDGDCPAEVREEGSRRTRTGIFGVEDRLDGLGRGGGGHGDRKVDLHGRRGA